MLQHFEVDGGMLVPREANEADFPLLLGFYKRFSRTAGCKMTVRIILIDHLVHLPKIEIVRP